MPQDPWANYLGDKAANYYWGDFVMKYIVAMMFAPEEKKPELKQALLDTHIPALLTTFTEKCLGESKFLCGEEVTIYDFVCAGGILNSFANPNGRLGAEGKAAWEKAPERYKKYIADFSEVMKEYLDKRAADHGTCTF